MLINRNNDEPRKYEENLKLVRVFDVKTGFLRKFTVLKGGTIVIFMILPD